MSVNPSPVLDPWISEFRKLEMSGTDWINEFRKSSMDRFALTGLPTTNHEDWRFTSLAPVARMPFKPCRQSRAELPKGLDLSQIHLGGLPGTMLVFVDGTWIPEVSKLDNLPDGVMIRSLKHALEVEPESVRMHLGALTGTRENPFAELNGAFFHDGALIQIPAHVQLCEPLRLVHVSTGPCPGASTHFRNLIRAGEGSKLQVVEHYLSTGSAPYLTNVVTELWAERSAQVELIKFQEESINAAHLSTLTGRFDRESQVRIHSFSLGARLARNNLRVALAGAGLECVLNGLYLTRGDQLADHHMIVEHIEPHCASHEYFNGILDDQSRGVFHGRILVQQAAQKTDAKQTNKNLLLSDEATANTKPQLEIYADDVRCTHGATIGQLDEDSIFYLRARGIGLENARRMLIHAFAGEIIGRIQCAAAREAVDRIVWDRLESNPRVGTLSTSGALKP